MSDNVHEEGKVELLPVTTVHAFPVNTFVENVAVRKEGQILVTVHNTESLYQIDPNSSSAPSLVHRFPAGISGIVECHNDVFYISSGAIGASGTWVIYSVDMNSYSADTTGTVQTPATITKVVDIPSGLFLNGSALLSVEKGLILAADSILGSIFIIDVLAATHSLWLHHSAFEKVTPNPVIPGINGIKIHADALYASNTDSKKFFRAPLAGNGLLPTGDVEIVAEKIGIDDFIFDADGAAYLATHIFQSVVKLAKDGTRSRIAGGPEDKIVAGTTAVAFGRLEGDRKAIYVTTTGGMSLPVDGKVEAGRVLKIEVGVGGDGTV